MLGSTSWFPPRQVVKAAFKSDWEALGAIGAPLAQYAIKLNSVTAPLNAVIAVPQTFNGLSTLLNGVGGAVNSVYQWYRILANHLTVEVMYIGDQAAAGGTPGLELALYPSQASGPTASSMIQAANQAYVKTATIWSTSTKPVKMSSKITTRKFLGLTKETFGQDEYYGASGFDPANTIYWILMYQTCPALGTGANTWAWRFHMNAIIELSEPYNNSDIPPTLTEKKDESKDDFDMVSY